MRNFSPTTLNQWLQRYESNLALDSSGMCFLEADSNIDIAISLSPDSSSIMLYSPLNSVDLVNPNENCLEALSLNLYRDISCEGTLGYDKRSEKLVFTYIIRFTGQIETKDEFLEHNFHNTLNNFIEKVKRLQDHFSSSAIRKDGSTNITPSWITSKEDINARKILNDIQR